MFRCVDCSCSVAVHTQDTALRQYRAMNLSLIMQYAASWRWTGQSTRFEDQCSRYILEVQSRRKKRFSMSCLQALLSLEAPYLSSNQSPHESRCRTTYLLSITAQMTGWASRRRFPTRNVSHSPTQTTHHKALGRKGLFCH